MKKRFYLLFPVVVLMILGSFMIPAKAATINDPQDDIIGIRTWTEGEEEKFDCDWTPDDASMIDIQTISWIEAGPNYTITMTFYGTPNDGLLQNGTVSVMLFFLIDGSSYPEDLQTLIPTANLTISAENGGTVMGTTIQTEVMTLSAHSLIWSFPITLAPGTPAAVDSWDLIALTLNGYDETVGDITYSYAAVDHYNFDFYEETLTLVCAIADLDIPGYSLIAVGVIAVITIGVILKKKYKK